MIIRFGSILFVSLLVLNTPAVRAQDATTNSAAASVATPNPVPKAAKKAKRGSSKATGLAFHGKLEAVDKAAMTITIAGKDKPRVVAITSRTRITKAGKPATLSDLAIGDAVTGQVTKNANGREEAVRLKSGTADAKAKTKPKTPTN